LRDSFFKEQYNFAQTSKDKLGVNTAVSFAAAVIMLVLSLVGIPVRAVGIAGVITCLIVLIFCFHEMKDGIVSVFYLAPSNDTLNAFALVAAVFQSVILIINEVGTTFTFAVFLSIAFSTAMKYIFACEISENLNLIKKHTTYSVNLADITLKKRYFGKVCLVNPVEKFPNIVETTYESDPSEQKIRLFVPILSSCIVIASIVIGIINGFNTFAASLVALFAVSASFTGEMSYVLPYAVAQKKLRKRGSVLLGYHSIEELQNAETIVVDDIDLFPPNLTELEMFRIKDKERINDAVEYTASLLIASASPFADTFAKSCGCNVDRLPEVVDWKFQKDYGIFAHIYDDEVILGNRNMLLSYDILPLSQETEASLVSTNRNIIYVAINGKVSAYIIVKYVCDSEMKKAAESVGSDFSIIVTSCDANITENMVQKRYELHNAKIIVPSSEEIKRIDSVRESVSEETEPVMITTKNAIGILSSVRLARKLGSVVNISVLTKLASIILGVVLTTAAFFISPSSLNAFWVILFNLIWTVPVVFISLVKK